MNKREIDYDQVESIVFTNWHEDYNDELKFEKYANKKTKTYCEILNSIFSKHRITTNFSNLDWIYYSKEIDKITDVNVKNNNVFVPVENLMGMFETYVYTKDTFDPAPRIFQECKYFGKEVIYQRDKSIHDGGSVYWNRKITKPNISPILEAIEELHDTV